MRQQRNWGAFLRACSAYVDLNPVRAGIAETREMSDFTSVQDRCETVKAYQKAKTSSAGKTDTQPVGLG